MMVSRAEQSQMQLLCVAFDVHYIACIYANDKDMETALGRICSVHMHGNDQIVREGFTNCGLESWAGVL